MTDIPKTFLRYLNFQKNNKTSQEGDYAIYCFGKMKVYLVFCRFGKEANVHVSTSFRFLFSFLKGTSLQFLPGPHIIPAPFS